MLPLSPMDSENTMDSFGELLTVGQPYMGGDGFSPSDNSWVLDDGDYPLLIAPETCWYGMTELIAREVARRRLTIVMLDKKYDGEQGEGRLRTLRQDLNFTCGAQIVELNKPDQLSDYNRYILKTELYKNNIHIEDDPYDDILTHLDEFRRSHGGLCNSNILRYVKVLRKQGKKDCRVELTRAQALAPITLQSQENALQAAADLAAEMKEELWGCESVKAQLESIVDLMQMDCTRRKRGLPTSGHGQIFALRRRARHRQDHRRQDALRLAEGSPPAGYHLRRFVQAGFRCAAQGPLCGQHRAAGPRPVQEQRLPIHRRGLRPGRERAGKRQLRPGGHGPALR